ncbi:PQQ-binding-like beta-propeller repeat protein [Chloroflexota bacterium]
MKTRILTLVLSCAVVLSLVLPAPILASTEVDLTALPATLPAEAVSSPADAESASLLSDELYKVTLITGDMVIVSMNPEGKNSYAVSPADPGKLGQSFLTLESNGDTYVLPQSVDLDRLDMELFNVDYLVREEYFNLTSLPLLISYKSVLTQEQTQTLEDQIAILGQDVTGHPSISTIATSISLDNLADSYQVLMTQPEIEKVWLDKKVHASLYDSVPLIDAPELWDSGYDGSGVEIAIIDTGIDATHPDLDDLDDDPATTDPKVVVQVNFSDDPGFEDLRGHGTHVAGTAAGTGSLPLPWEVDGATQLTTDENSDMFADWSPDGSQIVFMSNRDGNWDIWLMNADGSSQTKLINLATSDWTPAWSPDGTQIAFSRMDGTAEENGLWILDVSDPISTLTRVYEAGIHPSWSPDGTEIAFYLPPADASYGGDIWAINVSGELATLRQITTDTATDWRPDWSPDGSEIAFISDRGPNGTEEWHFTTAGPVTTSTLIGWEGGIYFGSDDGNLYALNPDGSERWHFTTGGPIQSSPVIFRDELLIFGSDDGNLYAIDRNGNEQWRFTTGGPIQTTPAVFKENLLLFGSDDGNVYMIDQGSGNEKWHFSTGGPVRSSPAVKEENEVVHFGSDDGNFYAVHGGGNLYWSYPVGSSIQSSPAIGNDGIIYFGADDGVLYALDAEGNLADSFPAGGAIKSSPAIANDGAIIFGSDDNNVYCLNPDLTERWHFTTGGTVRSQPTLANFNTHYVGSSDGNLYALYPDGTEKWSFATGGPVNSSAVMGNNAIYIGSDDGNLYALHPACWVLFLVDAALGDSGSTPTKLVSTIPFGEPTWSPDGSRLAFGGNFIGSADIFLINPDGSGLAPVVVNQSWDGGPTWSPDGTQIAFRSDRSGNPDIWKVAETDKRVKGVAPGALLWNVKVLNGDNWGYNSWVINGIEYASLGPDGVPGTGDEADIINLSLYNLSNSDGTDPLSQAVNAAVEAGVVVVVIAGNEGRGSGLESLLGTITVPGIAQGALTVGASTKDDEVAWFSSRGPAMAPDKFLIKPDVVAPGAGIYSTVPQALYGYPYWGMSGTSMAAPHVSGSAALLLEAGNIPPGWSNTQYLKNSLISTATVLTNPDTGLPYSVFEQGGGRIDLASGAADTPVLVDPATMSLGTFTSADTSVSRGLNFYNRDVVSHDLGLTATMTDLYSGADHSAAVSVPAIHSVSAGDGSSVGMDIDLAALPAGFYEGRVTITIDGAEPIHVIFSFVKVWTVTVNKTDINSQPAANHEVFAFHSELGGIEYHQTDESGSTTFMVAADGTYQVVSWGWDEDNNVYIITVAEDVAVSSDTVVNLDETTTVPIDFDPNKPDQVIADRTALVYFSSPTDWGVSIGVTWWYPESTMTRVSPISTFDAGFTYSYYPMGHFNPDRPDMIETDEWHNLLYSEDEIISPITYTADYATLVQRQTGYKVALNPEVAGWVQFASDDLVWPAPAPWFLMPVPHGRTEWLSPEPAGYNTSFWKADPEREWTFHSGHLSYPAGAEEGFVMGAHPLNSGAMMDIDWGASPAILNIWGSISDDVMGNSYANHRAEHPMGQIRVVRDGEVVAEHEIKDFFEQQIEFEGTPQFTVELWGNVMLPLSGGSYTGLNFTADPAHDSRPPEVSFWAAEPYANMQNIVPGGQVNVRIRVDDDSPIAGVSLHYSLDDGNNWTQAPLTDEGDNTWLADLGEIHDTFVTLSVDAQDVWDNSIHRNTWRGLYVGPPGIEDGWTVRLSASSPEGDGFQDPDNFAGVAPDASEQYDDQDAFNPPTPPSPYLDLLFPHQDWDVNPGNYAQDIRPPADSITWQLNVRNAGFDGNITIDWDVSQVPGSYQSVILADLSSGATTDMRSVGSYTYTAFAGETRAFNFIVGQKVILNTTFSDGWNMFSLPLHPDPADWDYQLGDEISPLYTYYYDPVAHGYRMYPSTSIPLANGLGYWAKVYDETEIAVEGFLVSDEPQAIHLLSGWNQIGQPFNYPVDWGDVLVYNTATEETVDILTAHENGWVLKYMYWYNPDVSGYAMETAPDGVLTPWLGYWVRALVECDLIIPNTPM